MSLFDQALGLSKVQGNQSIKGSGQHCSTAPGVCARNTLRSESLDSIFNMLQAVC